MLKVRIIPILLHKNVGLVKGVGFDSWRRVGSALQSVRVYSLRCVDELVFLDITATAEQRPPDFATVDELADECFMPLTVGGGVRSVQDIRNLLMVGADKVALNSVTVSDPEVVRGGANRFGSQCIVASIDYRTHPDGRREVYTRAGTLPTGLDPVEHARRMEELGAGEILLCSIERDGTLSGFDVEGVRLVSDAVSIPVIASGGCGCYEDFHQVISRGGAAAVGAASIYHFTEQTPLEAKHYLAEKGVPVRL